MHLLFSHKKLFCHIVLQWPKFSINQSSKQTMINSSLSLFDTWKTGCSSTSLNLILAWRSLKWQTSFLVFTQTTVVFLQKEAQELDNFWKWKAIIDWETISYPEGGYNLSKFSVNVGGHFHPSLWCMCSNAWDLKVQISKFASQMFETPLIFETPVSSIHKLHCVRTSALSEVSLWNNNLTFYLSSMPLDADF